MREEVDWEIGSSSCIRSEVNSCLAAGGCRGYNPSVRISPFAAGQARP